MEWDVGSYRELGFFLGQRREQLGVTLSQAAATLHIREKYLRAIEAGDVRQMPAAAYVRGYILSYAAALGISREELDARLQVWAEDQQKKQIYFPEVFTTDNKPSHRLVQLCAVLALLIYAGWAIANRADAPQMPQLVYDEGEALPGQPSLSAAHPCAQPQDSADLLPCYYSQLAPSAGIMPEAPLHSVLELGNYFGAAHGN